MSVRSAVHRLIALSGSKLTCCSGWSTSPCAIFVVRSANTASIRPYARSEVARNQCQLNIGSGGDVAQADRIDAVLGKQMPSGLDAPRSPDRVRARPARRLWRVGRVRTRRSAVRGTSGCAGSVTDGTFGTVARSIGSDAGVVVLAGGQAGFGPALEPAGEDGHVLVAHRLHRHAGE